LSGEQKNVLGGRLQTCSREPLTGFFRTGCCHTGRANPDGHTVCARMTQELLAHASQQGNDLVTPTSGFPGLRPGDRWCVRADAWLEAHQDGVAPPICLEATNEKALEVVPLELLRDNALPPEEPSAEDRARAERLTRAAKRPAGTATDVTVRVSAADMQASIRFYVERLGFDLLWEWGEPTCVAGLQFGSLDLQLDGEPETDSADGEVRVTVDDVDALFAQRVRNGVQPEHPPTDRLWGLRDYLVIDPMGFGIRFSQDSDDATRFVIVAADCEIRSCVPCSDRRSCGPTSVAGVPGSSQRAARHRLPEFGEARTWTPERRADESPPACRGVRIRRPGRLSRTSRAVVRSWRSCAAFSP
jgi:uncharacterized protein (DUF2237 family)/catechol 2,3-dioxygenase-like lactoylglutathione lyase family enzyme